MSVVRFIRAAGPALDAARIRRCDGDAGPRGLALRLDGLELDAQPRGQIRFAEPEGPLDEAAHVARERSAPLGSRQLLPYRLQPCARTLDLGEHPGALETELGGQFVRIGPGGSDACLGTRTGSEGDAHPEHEAVVVRLTEGAPLGDCGDDDFGIGASLNGREVGGTSALLAQHGQLRERRMGRVELLRLRRAGRLGFAAQRRLGNGAFQGDADEGSECLASRSTCGGGIRERDFGLRHRAFGLEQVGAGQLACLLAPEHVCVQSTSVLQAVDGEPVLELGALPFPPGVANRRGQPQPGCGHPRIDGRQLRVGQSGGAFTLAGQPQRRRQADVVLALSRPRADTVGAGRDVGHERAGRPGGGGLSCRQCGVQAREARCRRRLQSPGRLEGLRQGERPRWTHPFGRRKRRLRLAPRRGTCQERARGQHPDQRTRPKNTEHPTLQ